MYDSNKTISNMARNRLMATVSTVALIASAWACGPAFAADTGQDATLWVELGWQADNVHFSDSKLDLPLGPLVPQSGLTAPLMQNLNPARSNGIEDAITYKPEGSDWQFSASIRFGRSGRKGKLSQALAPVATGAFETYKLTYPLYPAYNTTNVQTVPATRDKLNGETSSTESHIILDFQAGKDVGVGMFGHGSTSVLSAGVRFAQFKASRKVSNFQETQGVHFQTSHFITPTASSGFGTRRQEYWNTISANSGTSQMFTGLGPSLKWEASTELWHDPRGGEFSLDWGVNAALLFGKQKKTIQHQTKSAEHCFGVGCPTDLDHYTSASRTRVTKTVTVPNVGGFVGFSLAYPNAKVSFGYRADLFVNAIDVGFGTRKSSDMLFHGPYASISIGIGD